MQEQEQEQEQKQNNIKHFCQYRMRNSIIWDYFLKDCLGRVNLAATDHSTDKILYSARQLR